MAIRLGDGDDIGNLDFVLQAARPLTIRGTLDGFEASAGAVTILVDPQVPDAVVFESQGRLEFEIRGLPAGPVSVSAVSNNKGHEHWGRVDLSVDRDMTDIVIRPAQLGTLRGRQRSDEKEAGHTVLRLLPLLPLPGSSGRETIAGADGHFVIGSIVPGEYRLAAYFEGRNSPPRNLFVQSLTLNGRNSADWPLAFKPGEEWNDTEIILSARGPRLLGQVQGPANGMHIAEAVLIYPYDRSMWRPQTRRIRAVRVASDGSFSLDDMPTGRYRVVACVLSDPQDLGVQTASFLERLEAPSSVISVSDGSMEISLEATRCGG